MSSHETETFQSQITEVPPAGVPAATPVVVPERKKKRKYSKGLRPLAKIERAVSKSSARVARAVAAGMEQYRKRADKSARKKRDGALRDFTVNLAGGVGKTLRVLSRVPGDLAKGMNTKRARKRVRRQVRVAARMLRPLG
jgi:hypothetical protein